MVPVAELNGAIAILKSRAQGGEMILVHHHFQSVQSP
jgi:hypothetical protein